MKQKFDIKSLLLGALLGAVIVFSIAAATGKDAWDYKIISGRLRQATQSIHHSRSNWTGRWAMVGRLSPQQATTASRS